MNSHMRWNMVVYKNVEWKSKKKNRKKNRNQSPFTIPVTVCTLRTWFLYLVESEEHCVFGASFAKSDVEFWQVLLYVGQVRGASWWKKFGKGQSNGFRHKFPIADMVLMRTVGLGCPLHRPPQSHGFALSYHQLFRSLQISVIWKNFNFLENCKNHSDHFIIQKNASVCKNGIMKLAQR